MWAWSSSVLKHLNALAPWDVAKAYMKANDA